MVIAAVIILGIFGILAGTTLQGINPNNLGEVVEFSSQSKRIGRRLTIISIGTIVISLVALAT